MDIITEIDGNLNKYAGLKSQFKALTSLAKHEMKMVKTKQRRLMQEKADS